MPDAVVYHPDGRVERKSFAGKVTLEEMQALIGGGYVRVVPGAHYRERTFVVCDEDGLFKRMEPNVRAMEAIGWVSPYDLLVGPVAVFEKRPKGW